MIIIDVRDLPLNHPARIDYDKAVMDAAKALSEQIEEDIIQATGGITGLK